VSEQKTIYNSTFWIAYLANVLLVTGNALTFRFADLINFLGGNQQTAGTIVSAGVIGALIIRLVMGQALDRYGTRLLWSAGTLSYIIGCAIFFGYREIDLVYYLARILFAMGIATMITCSMVHIQNQAPPNLRTEIIATLGSSGFLGMTLGPQLGDFIAHNIPTDQGQFAALFGCAAACGVVYLCLVFLLTRNDAHQRPQQTPHILPLLFRYWPGTIILVACFMGVSFNAVSVFLIRYSDSVGLSGIGSFFTVYAFTAFCFRLMSRRWSAELGVKPTIMLGLLGHGLGYVILPFVATSWLTVDHIGNWKLIDLQLLLPAFCCGFGHALLFPIVISRGAGAFPVQYRGTGTTIILGFTEIGAMLSSPVMGWVIDHYGFTPMFYGVAAICVTVCTIFILSTQRATDSIEEEIASRKATRDRLAEQNSVPELESPPVLAPVCNRVD